MSNRTIKHEIKLQKSVIIILGILAVSLINIESFGAGNGDHRHDKFENIGSLGEISKATRIVRINMFDNYFQPKSLRIKEGETVSFIIRNSGEFVHEFNIGTKKCINSMPRKC